MKLKVEWISGNRVQLLENGDAYFPAVFDAIDAAEREILIETFILFEDRVGRDLQQQLISAAARGVEVDLTIDGFGSPDLSSDFISALTDAGVRLHVYEPTPPRSPTEAAAPAASQDRRSRWPDRFRRRHQLLRRSLGKFWR